MAGDSDDADDGDEMTMQALDALVDLATTVIEQAHETIVAALPHERDAQLAQANSLRQAGADLITIANACEVAVRLGNG